MCGGKQWTFLTYNWGSQTIRHQNDINSAANMVVIERQGCQDRPVSYPFGSSEMNLWALACRAALYISSSETSQPYLIFSLMERANSTDSWLTTEICTEEQGKGNVSLSNCSSSLIHCDYEINTYWQSKGTICDFSMAFSVENTVTLLLALFTY